MTEQPQREYIITEKLTSEIEGYLKEKFPDCIAMRIPRVIRSRQHTPAPEPISQIKCFYCGQICTPKFGGVFRGCAICPECIEKGEDTKEARTEAARKATLVENKRVLDDLDTFVRTDHSLNRQIWKRITLAKIQSLRSTTGAQEMTRDDRASHRL